jgi:hypothetical protein
MSLAEELYEIAKEARNNAYLAWRKISLTGKFFEDLKKSASAGKYCYEISDLTVENEEHWKRWATDHGLKYSEAKIWWTVQ